MSRDHLRPNLSAANDESFKDKYTKAIQEQEKLSKELRDKQKIIKVHAYKGGVYNIS
jgi:hypothetical protein